jgi:hypothetical protein
MASCSRCVCCDSSGPLKRGALPFLRKLKYKDVELEFAEKIKELDSAINKELPSSPDIDLDQATALDRFIQLAQISPRAAIFEAWREVEAAVINSAKSNIEKLQPEIDRWKSRLKIDTGQVTDFDLIRAFDRSDLLDPEMRELYRALRGLRNRALHHDERQIEVDVAIEYGAMAYGLRNLYNQHASYLTMHSSRRKNRAVELFVERPFLVVLSHSF